MTAGIAETLTSQPGALREAWYRYRIEEGKGEQAFAGLFGLNVGQDEVDRGRAFVTGVIERAGESAWPACGKTRSTCPPRRRSTRPASGSHASA